MNKKILIIGASGFLGNYLFNNLKYKQIKGTYYSKKINKLVYLNILNYQKLKHFILRYKPDIVIYTAGITDTNWCEENRKASFKINAYIVKYILQLKLNFKFIYFSTDYVFDDTKLHSENSKKNPLNIYGKSKSLGEFFVKKYSNNYVILRVSGLYHHKINKLNSKIIISEDNRFSNPIHIENILNILNKVIENNLNGVFNLFGNINLSRYEFIQFINMNSVNNFKIYPSYYIKETINKPMFSNLKTNKKNHIHYNINSIHKYNSEINYQYKKDYLDVFLEKKNIKLIVFDTIGALLTKRKWKDINRKYIEIDNLCGKISKKNKYLLDDYNENLEVIASNISSLYTLNPYIWEKIKRWKGKYKLILINNGWNKTFNIWKEKYGLDNHFIETINSYEIETRKEHPYFFKKILDKYNLKNNEIILFDDDKDIINIVKNQNIYTFLMRLTQDFPLDKYEVEKEYDA